MTDSQYDVVIVGYGPVGQVAANLLGQYGHRVAVFETATSIYNKPRAVHFDAEVMRIFQSIGLAETVLPSTAPIKGVDFLNGDGGVLFGVRTRQRKTLNGWDGDYMFYQPQLEDALQAGAKRFDNVEVHPGHEVLDIRASDDSVEVDVKQLLTGTTFTVTADYVIGCDGARSLTRKLAGIELEDMKFDQPWLVIDTMLKHDNVYLPDVAQQICDPKRPTTFVPSSGRHRRWEIMLMPGDDPEEVVKIDRVWELLSPWISPDDAEVIRHVVYTFHAVIADPWRNGRMLIAGDAAHQMPPFLGQGMCAGIRDAANLCWKLDLIKRGLASEALLDTYQEERSPHVRTIIQRAVLTGGIIQTTDPEVAKQRDERFSKASGSAGGDDEDGPFNMSMPGLTGGVRQAGSDRVGKPFPQGPSRSEDGREELLDEFIGVTFAIVTDAATAKMLSQQMTPEVTEVIDSLDIALIALDTTVPGVPQPFTGVADETCVALNWLGDGNIAVVRPDRYAYGIATDADSLSEMLLGLEARLAGAGEPVS